MATRIKTVEYWFPELASVTDNTDTNFTQITVYLPESSKIFRSVYLEIIIQDAEATSNNVTRRQVSVQLGAAGYSAVNNTNVYTSGGEQKWIMASGDFTSYFGTNWSGASMTCDARILCDSAIATPVQNWRGATARLVLTYEYDDASSTHVKTIYWPLKTPVASLGTTKPGTATDNGIPAFDTELPESTKTIRQIALVVQGNDEYSGTTDHTLSWEVDTGGVYTTCTYELALNTSCWFRHCQIQSFATNATHSFYLWTSLASHAHSQAFLVITYEFDPAASSTIWNSLRIPANFGVGAGATTNADYQRAITKFSIQEPTTITAKRSAIQLFWEQNAGLTGAQYRVGSGSWSGAITSLAAVVAGSCGASHECTAYITLARGLNTLTADAYVTSGGNYMDGISGLWIINYTSGKATDGVGVHNKTILDAIHNTGLASSNGHTTTTKQFYIPESNYFINSFGVELKNQSTSSGITIMAGAGQMERLSGEGGLKWETIVQGGSYTDTICGIRTTYGADTRISKRFTNDYDSTRLDIETSRRYRNSMGTTMFPQMVALITQHAITYTIQGTITNSAGGTVYLKLINVTTGEIEQQITRTGNGTYSITCYNNTTQYWVDAYENGTHLGRSGVGYAS